MINNALEMEINALKEPMYVTRPLTANPRSVNRKITTILKSGWLTNFGHQHYELTVQLKRYLGCKNLDLFCNGHTALDIAIKALQLKGEVITTPFTFASTVHALYLNDIRPVFCDIDPHTYTIDPAHIEQAITPKTTAILAVHVFGYPCDRVKIERIARKHHLKVVYDAAHAFGVRFKKKSLASWGDISMYSFHATKAFNTIEGGCLTFKDSKLARTIYLLKNFGIEDEERVSIPGVNGKMNEIQAGIGLLNLPLVTPAIRKRKKITEWYTQELSSLPGITFPPTNAHVEPNYAYYPVLIDAEQFGLSRDSLIEALKKYNIFARKYFFPLASNFDCYRHLLSARSHNIPVAQRVSEQVLCLPIYHTLTAQHVRTVCRIIKHLHHEAI